MAFPNRNLNQKCVYWGAPVSDGYGGFTFNDPVEIKGRWEDSTKIIRASDGEEKACMAEIQVEQDVDENGMLYLGELDDLSTAEKADPTIIDGACHIIRFDKIPTIKGTRFFRKAYL